jgi:hypothetical protein
MPERETIERAKKNAEEGNTVLHRNVRVELLKL